MSKHTLLIHFTRDGLLSDVVTDDLESQRLKTAKICFLLIHMSSESWVVFCCPIHVLNPGPQLTVQPPLEHCPTRCQRTPRPRWSSNWLLKGWPELAFTSHWPREILRTNLSSRRWRRFLAPRRRVRIPVNSSNEYHILFFQFKHKIPLCRAAMNFKELLQMSRILLIWEFVLQSWTKETSCPQRVPDLIREMFQVLHLKGQVGEEERSTFEERRMSEN